MDGLATNVVPESIPATQAPTQAPLDENILAQAAVETPRHKRTTQKPAEVQGKVVKTMSEPLKHLHKQHTPNEQWLLALAADLDKVPADRQHIAKQDMYTVLCEHIKAEVPPPPYSGIFPPTGGNISQATGSGWGQPSAFVNPRSFWEHSRPSSPFRQQASHTRVRWTRISLIYSQVFLFV